MENQQIDEREIKSYFLHFWANSREQHHYVMIKLNITEALIIFYCVADETVMVIHGATFKFTGYLKKAKSGLLQNSLKEVLGEKILPQYDI